MTREGFGILLAIEGAGILTFCVLVEVAERILKKSRQKR